MDVTVQTVMNIWYSSGDFKGELEKIIKPLFGTVIFETGSTIESWAEFPTGRLGLIFLYDQAPRSLFDDTPRMYVYDHLAQPLTTRFYEDGTYLQLTPNQQSCCFLPYHHSENLDHQTRVRPIFERLAKEDKKLEWLAKATENYNHIIGKFGRFPHRNIILGRETTGEEWKFLVEEWYDEKEIADLIEKGVLPVEYRH